MKVIKEYRGFEIVEIEPSDINLETGCFMYHKPGGDFWYVPLDSAWSCQVAIDERLAP